MLTAPAREELNRELFGNMDGLHIRNAYLAKQIGDHVTAKADKEIDRVSAMFNWVCRNMELIPEDETSPPLPFYELLMMGRGRTFDRAVVFAELLRQFRIDTVILHPQGALEADTPWIIGVLLDGQVYLFDARLGFPIPRGDAPPTAANPSVATLEEVLKNPGWLTALAMRSDQPYEPSVEQLQTAQVSVLPSVMAWSPRMWRIEQLLPGDRLCVLYDPPAKIGDAPSLFERVEAAFPEQAAKKQVQLYADPFLTNPPDQTEQQAIGRSIQTAQATLAVPFVSNKESGTPGGSPLVPSHRQRKTRMTQLQGRYAEAIAQYVSIRQLGTSLPPEPGLGPIYARAAEDAFYWSCLCKVDAGQYDSAATSLGDYITRYRRGGRWLAGARQALADCQIARQQYPEAIETLKQTVADDPARASTAVQIKRLSGLTIERDK
ncbi:MAG TPA: transglutaminase domain-containing protein [Planctomycetaceae bacterium]|nr:transglutaminase domain-containing protein [Planctomycetaceae bacterium]